MASTSAAQAAQSVATRTYASRVQGFANPAARALLETMERKRSNLAVSVDVTKKADLLKVAETVGPDVCMIKTHIDIVEDFDMDLVEQLTTLSSKFDFHIFEDRKFADIGNTVSLQYASGVHKIASWSHITNAHLVPGPGIITGLADVGVPLGRGLLLLAEMSSKGNLAGGDYGRKCVEAARQDETGFTCGFIAMDRIDERNPPADGSASRDFLILTPGVGLDVQGDSRGQQYRTPHQVVKESGCDVIIVGRGIYGALLKDGSTDAAFQSVKEQAARYKEAGWSAYLDRTGQQPNYQLPAEPSSPSVVETLTSKRHATPPTTPSSSKKRRFVPSHPVQAGSSTLVQSHDQDAALARQLAEAESSSGAYKLRRRTAIKVEEEEGPSFPDFSGSAPARSTRSSVKTAINTGVKTEMDSADEEDKKAIAKKAKPSPFDISPQKTNQKPIKLNLDASEVKPAPKRWKQQLEVLSKQRKRIIAPVDEVGCEENGRDERRADAWRQEDEEDKRKRERFTVLVSLMLSSQTKDEVTGQAVRNLQSNLPLGLCLQGILDATDDEISSNINKVGFWRRKTGYIKSAASILASRFDADVPKDIDELCSLPGVGPKMAFLCLQSAWKINLGIGVDVHVHRLSNRLGWCKTNDPEGTRLVLQSWLPKELHHSINKTLVGFGQVLCVPVGPRCDDPITPPSSSFSLCDLGKARLCPSYRKVDAKAAAARKQVVLLPEENEEPTSDLTEPKAAAAVTVDGPDGPGSLAMDGNDGEGLASVEVPLSRVKEEASVDW